MGKWKWTINERISCKYFEYDQARASISHIAAFFAFSQPVFVHQTNHTKILNFVSNILKNWKIWSFSVGMSPQTRAGMHLARAFFVHIFYIFIFRANRPSKHGEWVNIHTLDIKCSIPFWYFIRYGESHSRIRYAVSKNINSTDEFARNVRESALRWNRSDRCRRKLKQLNSSIRREFHSRISSANGMHQ